MDTKNLKSDLNLHWFVVGLMLMMLIAYNVICHTTGADIQINLPEEQRILIRTILYVVAIILFPFVNLLRFILLRLNQTMPGDNPAKFRYLMTIIVTQASIEIVSLFGLIMFVLGDDYNTLYIFSAMGALGIFLHRPKLEEYSQVMEALRLKKLQS